MKTRFSEAAHTLLEDTLRAVLGPVAAELSVEIDLRAKGFGKNVVGRVAIYARALSRDLMRIPRHYPRGIGQAQFRSRVAYISKFAIPTINFFLNRYPLHEHQHRLLSGAVGDLERAADLIADGRIHVIDEWYATMEEFYLLTEYSREAAAKISEAITAGD